MVNVFLPFIHMLYLIVYSLFPDILSTNVCFTNSQAGIGSIAIYMQKQPHSDCFCIRDANIIIF